MFTELFRKIVNIFVKDKVEDNQPIFSDEVEKEIKDNAIEVERNLNDQKYEAE